MYQLSKRILDPSHPGNGRVYICRLSERNDPQWSDVREGLIRLGSELELNIDNNIEMSVALEVFAQRFGTDQRGELKSLIEHHMFEGAADLDTLFWIATLFDDGHGLTEIHFEGCWYCSKPGMFVFGGDGCFLSREVSAFSDSRQACELGPQIRGALLRNQPEFAAEAIAWETRRLIAQINDESQRRSLLQKVLTRLEESKT